MRLDKFLINENSSLREALSSIESNHKGIIFITNDLGSVIGVVTDGDIRRALLDGRKLDESISCSINKDFIFGGPETPRELILKKLDHRIRVIPILDSTQQLIAVVSRDHIPVQAEGEVYFRARAPARISFGGGGSDLTHYFSTTESGAVINTSIALFSHATLRTRDDDQVIIDSLDLHETLRANNLSSALSLKSNFGLIQAVLKVVNPDFGFELCLHSDFPVSSGLGGSAVISAAILGCFNELRRDKWDLHELAEIAYQAERHYFEIAGGWQDQYATVFGGFNFMEFRMDQNIIHPLRIHPNILHELEESLILCDTGINHDSGDIHQHQHQMMSNEHIRDLVKINVQLSYEMRNYLLRGRLLEFGYSLDKAWSLKRKLSYKVSSSLFDEIYDDAKACGAVGGKLLGAGGGGFFLFYVSPFRKYELIQHLKSKNLRVQPFRFDQEGLRSWTVRQSRNQLEFGVES